MASSFFSSFIICIEYPFSFHVDLPCISKIRSDSIFIKTPGGRFPFIKAISSAMYSLYLAEYLANVLLFIASSVYLNVICEINFTFIRNKM